LPAAGNAIPMTYEINGKQYLVIAAGGSQVLPEEPVGDAVAAFALP
jgi:quinoprotein glucose dehydrogenase